uniref:FBD domain-containing protein n=1 Tax=Oryza nivara TaxID=4536 RepID=A0A0E0HZ71_ORYNI
MRPDVNFAKFFVLNARMLKAMKFGVLVGCTEKWMANQHRRLQLDHKASPDAQFDFRRDYCWRNILYNKRIHDLARDDPFDDWMWLVYLHVPGMDDTLSCPITLDLMTDPVTVSTG